MTVEKRAAFESPVELARRQQVEPSMRRPAATVLGTILVVLRALAGVLWLMALALQWRGVLTEDLGVPLGSDAASEAASSAGLTVVLIVGAVLVVFQLMLAAFILRGSNWARITVMVFSTLSITSSAFDYFGADAEITLRTTLLTLALDILVLLALSSGNARAYARRPRS